MLSGGLRSVAVEYLQSSVHDPRDEDKPATHLAMMDIYRSQAISPRIIRAPEHDDMHQAHPAQQRYKARCHDLVFAEKSLGAYIPTTEADENNGGCKAGAPP